jgi:hypothetical protein
MPATATRSVPLSKTFAPLRDQLVSAAKAFTDSPGGLADLLAGLVADVDRLVAEPLEIFPVAHHSPAAALQLIRRLRESPPRVIFMELCEDLRPVLPKLRDCKLPVALQAFAQSSDAFPKDWYPLSVVAPITAFSAEFQAIAYCLENPSTELVFVDRSVDHVFQWMPQKPEELEKHLAAEDGEEPEAEDEEEAPPPSHGGALGVTIGRLEPTFDLFREFLLKNARVKYFAEWWDQYLEQPLHGADYGTFRQVMTLVGSLIRRLGRQDDDLETDRLREKYMWTRMKDYLRADKIDPRDAIHICGAAHAASDVPEFGTTNDLRWDVPKRTDTKWLYGVLPSSYQAIDHQFAFPPGTVTLSDASWERAHKALGVKPFELKEAKASGARKPAAATPNRTLTPPARPNGSDAADLMGFLTRSPELAFADDEQLLTWCAGIVALARKNGYLSTTADTIAVYHTSVMLAQLRNRARPTPYDFRDAAVTCLEKDRPPRKRDVNRLCDILLGGDRVGRVGFEALPPLAQNVHERLAPLKINLTASSVQRALMNFKAQPELLPCSDLLWKLLYLLGSGTVKPIMGEKRLGHVPVQESWDISIGRFQGPLIQLAYEGVTVEQVLEKRLHKTGFGPDATAVKALAAAEDALVFLKSDRLVEELGYQAGALLVQETGGQSAPEIFDRLRRLVHYYRSTPTGLPEWVKSVVATGYGHYTTLLPTAFEDAGTSPPQLAGMLAFLFTMEGLALSLGCSRTQFEIAVKQSGPRTSDHTKLGLLWTTEWLLGLRTADAIRQHFDDVLENPLAAGSIPAQLQGFLLALQFTPLVTRLVAELVGKAFERLPDRVLMPWLPGLILMLREGGEASLPALFKEVSANLPGKLAGLKDWQPPWHKTAAPAAPATTPAAPKPTAGGTPVGLLAEHPAALFAVSRLLGFEATPLAAAATAGPADAPAAETPALLRDHPATLTAVAKLLSR